MVNMFQKYKVHSSL